MTIESKKSSNGMDLRLSMSWAEYYELQHFLYHVLTEEDAQLRYLPQVRKCFAENKLTAAQWREIATPQSSNYRNSL